MTQSEFVELREEFSAYCDSVLTTKGTEYTEGNVDRLYNFYADAEEAEVTPLQVWWIHFSKHLHAIKYMVRGNELLSEHVTSRFVDLRNYIDLGYALYTDQVQQEKISKD